MSAPIDGGPAFPTQQETTANGDIIVPGQWGMSLRDASALAHEAERARRQEVEALLAEILDYRGGADSALEDEYVMERARALLGATP